MNSDGSSLIVSLVLVNSFLTKYLDHWYYRHMITEDHINLLIDMCIQALSDDNIEQGADQLYELAVIWARAGLTQKSFADIRKYIINEATAKTDAHFIHEKLKIAERKNYERRNRTCKSRIITTQNLQGKTIH